MSPKVVVPNSSSSQDGACIMTKIIIHSVKSPLVFFLIWIAARNRKNDKRKRFLCWVDSDDSKGTKEGQAVYPMMFDAWWTVGSTQFLYCLRSCLLANCCGQALSSSSKCSRATTVPQRKGLTPWVLRETPGINLFSIFESEENFRDVLNTHVKVIPSPVGPSEYPIGKSVYKASKSGRRKFGC